MKNELKHGLFKLGFHAAMGSVKGFQNIGLELNESIEIMQAMIGKPLDATTIDLIEQTCSEIESLN